MGTVRMPWYEPVRCSCGWPLFRITRDGISIKHHSCDVVTAFPWEMVKQWQAVGSAIAEGARPRG